MRKVIAFFVLFMLTLLKVSAQNVSVKWELSDKDNLSTCTMTGEDAYTSLITTSFTKGANIAQVEIMSKSNADDGYTAVTYSPGFTTYTPSTRVEKATSGHDISFFIKPSTGHTLKITRVSFDCARVGTDGGAIDATLEAAGVGQQMLSPIDIARNKISAGNTTGYSHNEYIISDLVATENGATLTLSIYGINGIDNEKSKSMAFRNIVIEGALDQEVYNVSHYLSNLSFTGKTGMADAVTLNLYNMVKDLKNGESCRYKNKLFGAPADFVATLQSGLVDEYTVKTNYTTENNTLTVDIIKGTNKEFTFSVLFSVSNHQPKGNPIALKRGLMAIHQSTGNLVSWRSRKNDNRNYKFKLFRGGSSSQLTEVNGGDYIIGKTNFLDTGGIAGAYYRLEVYDENYTLVESEVSKPTWDSQINYITLEGGSPTDPTTAGATYTPNDASFCDMDGDGEYEIVLKWAPSNEKDAASSGTTSPAFYACYKLNGRRLWMLHTGHNMFNSAHTTPFVAWDMDGDGFGEFMVKTAPGAVDGEGNYVLLGDDDPKANLKGGKGKQTTGSEYLTIFDGTTGAELKTIYYHTAYADETSSFWGDSNQNRSERYLAGIAWLDGEDYNPSAIFARGYYNGCKIGVYDWDGENLTMRWLHRGASANSGTVTYADGTVKNLTQTVYGEGAHSFAVGDVTGDGKQELTYGSGALNTDGTTLYRTGLGHGDAIHLGDFIPSRPGQEVFMAHEEKSSKGNYGVDLRDAKTGEILVRRTASGDTGRGLIAHFNPEAEDAWFQSSADDGLYDTNNELIASGVTHGGGAGLTYRVFWNGTLADDFFGKDVVEYWNPTAKAFNRMQVNGTNYLFGNKNNSSKQDPCVLGDLLGDWREEIVRWDQSGTDYRLVINATNYETDYIFPHLMDDIDYRAQLIAQNSVYNQPPHVSYDPRTDKTIIPETFELINPTKHAGKYWGSLYTTYPVYIPEGVTAWSVTNRSTDGADTLRIRHLTSGKIIPKDRAIIFNATTANPKFIPTSLISNATASAVYAKGFYCDSLVADVNTYKFTYEFRDGIRGVGFYRTNGTKVIPGGASFAQFGTSTIPGAESYVIGGQSGTTGIQHVEYEDNMGREAIYTIQGVRLKSEPTSGVYIKGGKKYIK